VHDIVSVSIFVFRSQCYLPIGSPPTCDMAADGTYPATKSAPFRCSPGRSDLKSGEEQHCQVCTPGPPGGQMHAPHSVTVHPIWLSSGMTSVSRLPQFWHRDQVRAPLKQRIRCSGAMSSTRAWTGGPWVQGIKSSDQVVGGGGASVWRAAAHAQRVPRRVAGAQCWPPERGWAVFVWQVLWSSPVQRPHISAGGCAKAPSVALWKPDIAGSPILS